MRRKGERPVVRQWQDWGPRHPVANMIATGDPWFRAWCMQAATTMRSLARKSGVPAPRLAAIDAGDQLTRAELEAIAAVWGVDPAQIVASLSAPSLLVE